MACDNCCFRFFCGKCCAICWIFIGIWAFFFLGILSILFMIDKQGNIGHFKHDSKENAKVCFAAWIVYVILTIFCAFNLYYRTKNPFPEKKDDETKKTYSTITPTRDTPLLSEYKKEK